MLNVHLDGSFHVSQPAFRVMKSQGYGRFVFIASSAGTLRAATIRPLRKRQGRARRLANVISIEGAAHGIRANSVLPLATRAW
jgi:NAD(P)-dependent dehydrogenase (short-subunit alcohol dehydrogenase family)